MSLVELVVAMTMLSVALVGLARFTGLLAKSGGDSRIQMTAVWLATDRLEAARSNPSYATIDSIFTATENSLPGPGMTGFVRKTAVQHVGGVAPDTIDDYKVVTVTVTHPQLATPVVKTSYIAAF